MLTSFALAGCAPFMSQAEEPQASILSTRCRVGATDLGPLVTEWTAAEKANLEALMQRKRAIAVQFTGCTMRVLPDCVLGGGYAWQRTSPMRDVLQIRNEAELYMRLPLGALSLEGELQRSGELFVETTVSGQYRLAEFTAEQVPQSVACLEATHIVGAVSVGAFQLTSGSRVAGGASVGYAGVGEASGKGQSSTRVLGAAGDPNACSLATPEAADPNCASPIQAFLSPIPGRGEPAGPPGSIKVGFASGDSKARFDVIVDDQATCTTPCDRFVDPSQPVTLRSRNAETLDIPSFTADKGPLQVTAYPTSYGELATGITFAALGGLAGIAGIVVTAVGCSSDSGDGCTAGIITGVAGLSVAAGGTYLILDSLPRADVKPIFDTREHRIAERSAERGLVLGPSFRGTF